MLCIVKLLKIAKKHKNRQLTQKQKQNVSNYNLPIDFLRKEWYY